MPDYKVFILLTGTIEPLRKQTQERVEEGFIGIDMSANTTGGKRVGVGLDNKPIHAMALTSPAQAISVETRTKLQYLSVLIKMQSCL